MVSRKKIAVVGIGYVGLSNAIALARYNSVIAYDTDVEKVSLVNEKKSPLNELDIVNYLANGKLHLSATSSKQEAFKDSEFIIIATPTNYDEETNYFNTLTVETVIRDILEINSNAVIIIRSTIPVGFVDFVREKFGYDNIIFCPEFLREGHSLADIFDPSRIVVGDEGPSSHSVAQLLLSSSDNKDVQVVFTGTQEAEAIKLFSNSYLAMRVSFFNELDTYCISKSLNAKQIIEGVSSDPRIGHHYNNPSFGYGGYCLPKDTKQLSANYEGIPNKLIKAIVDSNEVRKKYIVSTIVGMRVTEVGIHRLIMKSGSDNFRSSAILDIISGLLENNIKVNIFEPSIDLKYFLGCDVENDLDAFKNKSDLVITNRITEEILDIRNKIFTRDIYGTDQ
jgi:UDPglucose 6-dehydrogenase